MAAGRWNLWETTAAAVRASFPNRADDLLAELESRLEPGPWSARVRPRPKAAGAWSRDRVLADVERALRGEDEASADMTMRALERWLVDAAQVSLQALLGARGVDPDWHATAIGWAASALEAGLDTSSLRILAGLRENEADDIDDYLRRTLRELALDRSDEAELRAAACRFARDVVQGRIDAVAAERRLRDLTWSSTDADLAIWRELTDPYDDSVTDEDHERTVLEAARALLGAP